MVYLLLLLLRVMMCYLSLQAVQPRRQRITIRSNRITIRGYRITGRRHSVAIDQAPSSTVVGRRRTLRMLLLLLVLLVVVVVMHVVGRRPAHVMLMLLQAVFTHSPILPLPQTAVISLAAPGLILLDLVALIMAAGVVRRRAPIAKVGQMIPSLLLLLMVGMLLLLLRGVMMLVMAVVVQPRTEHVEVGLQRLEQFVHHIAARHRLVTKRVVGMMVGGRRRTPSPLGGVVARGSGRRWRAGNGEPLLMLAREVLMVVVQVVGLVVLAVRALARVHQQQRGA